MKTRARIVIIGSIIILTLLGILGVWLSGKYTGGGAKEASPFSFFGATDEDGAGLPGGKSGNGQQAGGGEGETGKPSLPELRKISSSPAAGVYAFEKSVKRSDGTKFNAMFSRRVDRITGNVYETRLDNMEETRVTNTTIPKIYEAVWGNNENSLILRYLHENGETIETFFSKITEGPEGKDGGLTGTFMPADIKNLAVSPKKDRMFYLTITDGEAAGTVMNIPDNGKKSVIFRHPFTEWLLSWPSDNTITLATKPSGKAPGFMYSIGASGGNLTKILGDINGLTGLMSPDGKKVLYSESASGGFSMKMYDIANGNSDDEPRTLPEKCVWSPENDVFYCAIPVNPPGGLYPDNWYQGLVSFSDVLARIDVKNGSITILVDPKEFAGEEIDAVNLTLSKNEDYLLFINKKDGAPWALEMGI